MEGRSTLTKLREDIRNIAIIAHVDHGKTTLVNEMLKQSDTLGEHYQIQDRAMDTNAIEKERGITILSKNTAVDYNGKKINILDTPGHADFGGEVERIMKMVDGVLLVVDAYEGTMPQTRFVLKKALEQHLTPIVVINKIDRPGARPEEVVDEVLELFIELGADDTQLDFPVIYASAINGTSSYDSDPAAQKHTMDPLFDTILKTIPAPVDNSDEPLQFQVALLDYNDYVGRIGIGRVFRGTIKIGDNVTVMKLDGSTKNFRVTKIFGFMGLDRVEVQEAKAGDLIAVSGMEDIYVGETVCPVDHEEALPLLRIDEPTLQMTFLQNNSPFAGREGTEVTARKIEERLRRQLHTDVSLKVEDTDQAGAWMVSGRGELHLSILVEEMRREGFELQLSRPEVIYKNVDGVNSEPFEEVTIDTPDEYVGSVIDSMSQRKGDMKNMESTGNGQTRLIFSAPSRGLIGYSTEFLSMTGGYGIMNHTYEEYKPVVKNWEPGRRTGALVSINQGPSTTYSLQSVEDRGKLFIGAGVEVYEGMVVGESNRDQDIAVTVTKGKNLTNTRAAGKDHAAAIKTPKEMSLEQSIEFLNEDELCEVTPKSVRLRKKILSTNERKKYDKQRKMSKKA
ncbi:translational GTPase TypA [Companilactobacillus keshanensis]|uniref:Large ribosomal subunit assembly factor BipA n=1 Tax=Companilactobacillus keshanensis TaxID=2486003 RepID=A0ABW4BUC0_9LACO|nr:translational GTPase TypA [Companilactobacillus keshanensis]